MKNKKILFLVLFICILGTPTLISAGPLCDMVKSVRDITWKVGGSIVGIGWVIAGIIYLTSAGSPEKTGIAKKALIAAVIGTVLVVLSGSAMAIIIDGLGSGNVNMCT